MLRLRKGRARNGVIASAVFIGALHPPSASAETIQSALVKAYQNNPQLNAQRAAVRAIDETVPQALSGYRPRLAVTGTLGEQFSSAITRSPGPTPPGSTQPTPVYSSASGTVTPWSVGAAATQTLYNGFQTANRTRAAESQVSSGREGLRVLEQTILLNGATAYMDVLRDAANLEDRKSTRLNSSHRCISYAVFCLKKKKIIIHIRLIHTQKTHYHKQLYNAIVIFIISVNQDLDIIHFK